MFYVNIIFLWSPAHDKWGKNRYHSHEIRIRKHFNIYQKYCFYCICNELNAALVSGLLSKTSQNLTNPKLHHYLLVGCSQHDMGKIDMKNLLPRLINCDHVLSIGSRILVKLGPCLINCSHILGKLWLGCTNLFPRFN